MKKIIALLILTLIAVTSFAREPLFQNGKSVWKIVIPATPAAPELYAAQELQQMILKISGAKLPIEKSDVPPSANAIVIGSLQTSPEIRAKSKTLNLKKDKIETLAIQTQNGNLYLAGNNPRGALYAVYSFLQNNLGVRWFWPGADGEFHPTLSVYAVPDTKWNYKPAFRFREMTPCYEQRNEATQLWLARNFLNGGARTTSIRDNGGFFRQDGQHWVTLSKKEFPKHPDYFSMIAGKRVPEGQAGCWSNPDFLKMMTEKHVKLIKDNQFELMKTIHADITQRCECPECTKNPDAASRWFEFYDKLVPEIRKSCPDVLFAGSAYQEHRKVPVYDIKHLEYVEYCHYNRCYVHKLSDPACKLNDRSMREIRNWQKKIPMAVYGYELDIFEPFMYVPFWNILADELREFRDIGVIRVKTELPVIHKKSARRADDTLQKLRLANYLYARLAWNPDSTADELLRDFCKTVYGTAGNVMYDYHLDMAAAWEKMPIHLSYFLSSPNGAAAHFLNAKRIAAAAKMFAEARKAAAKEPDSAKRKRILDNIQVDADLFADWEKLHRVTGVNAVVRVPQLSPGTEIQTLKPLPMLKKRDAALPTECRMYWTDDALHLQLVCMTPDMKNLRKGSPGNDVILWADDNIELFLDLNDGHSYRHLAVNPAGGKFDALGDDVTWNPDWTVRTELRQDRWIMDIALKFSSFGGAPPVDGTLWKIMVIRNGKPGPCGYPAAAHHDMSRAATLFFSKTKSPERAVLWLASPKLSGGKRFIKIMPELLKRGWQFDYAANAKEAESKDPALSNLIVIEKYQSELSQDYYRSKIIPAIRNGATAVFSCYFWTDDLPKLFNDETFRVQFVENAAKLRKITDVAKTSFASEPNDFRKILKFPPSGNLIPSFPEKWEILAKQATTNGADAPFLLARPLGKGMVVISGDIKENIPLLENLLEYNSKIKR